MPAVKLLQKIWSSPTLMTWGSFATNSLSLVVVLPLILIKLNTEEIVVWYLFSTIIGLQILVDLGFDSSLVDTLLIPNAFSPEGNNPIFRISNPAIASGETTLKIYNRWGEKIWEGDALDGWDGKVNGEVVNNGHYVYHLVGLYRRKRIEKSGMILLLR